MPIVKPGETGVKLVPINRMVPALPSITNINSGETVQASAAARRVRGIAFGGDTGVAKVDLSSDGGKTWQAAQLGKDEGKYSFRQMGGAFRRCPQRATIRLWFAAPTAMAWRNPPKPIGTHSGIHSTTSWKRPLLSC